MNTNTTPPSAFPNLGSASTSTPAPSIAHGSSTAPSGGSTRTTSGSAAIASTPQSREDEMMYFQPIGAGSEVGRSCHMLKFKGKTLMLDCGAHPAYNGLGALPFFDEIDPEEIDIVLITHFHIDHCASLPYLMEKTTFRGRVFMTHPTKAIFRWMLSDYVRVSASSADDMPYDEHDLQRAYDRIEPIDFHQVVEVEGVRFTAYNAGHVLGAAMFHIEIAGVRILYTGDYSREEDRHLMSAEQPRDPVDVLVCESTYGVQNHTPRAEREARFTSLVHQVVSRGGRCLIPIFALGRAQELLLILDEYWAEHAELQHVPIYYASNLARKCMAVYQTYMNMMNEHIRRQFATKNPFIFKHIQYLRSMASFDDVGPCVMMASPAMLQSGLSRELLEMWCPDKKNGLIIPGYVVEGTLGKHLLSEPSEITSYSGSKLPVRCSIDYISFSAHVDYAQNRDFIDLISPSHLILVHGETNMMNRLRQALVANWTADGRDNAPKVHAPKNAERVGLPLKGEKYAKALGNLASALEEVGADGLRAVTAKASGGGVIQGLVVAKDFHYHLVAVDELREFTDLRPATIHMRQYVPLDSATWELVVWHLGLTRVGSKSQHKAVHRAIVSDVVTVSLAGNLRELVVEWVGTPVNDVVADAVVAVLLHVESSPAAVKSPLRPIRFPCRPLTYSSFLRFCHQ
ncbi:cleavage and polyadenylation specificity factor subunit 3-like protein [Catenaria anguillulae PL171]|uniref:Endoribonuclease YSH1 n=1 Tax=Catenaria anguillulae PL171 TaxID=765915 RepID=A0A1Y2HWF5_9FUNG|nr:cleavage and polyadenylation specificity factor subunit 3-like protein [Catenaria anguillulae PL171]